jgi:hypothetical protein
MVVLPNFNVDIYAKAPTNPFLELKITIEVLSVILETNKKELFLLNCKINSFVLISN